jgi:hypothetical protein
MIKSTPALGVRTALLARAPLLLSATLLLSAALLPSSLAGAAEPAAGSAPAAHASASSVSSSSAPTSASSKSAAAPKEATKVTAQRKKTDNPLCVTETGSRIPPPKGQCLAQPGHVWSQQDLRSTGQPNVGQALRQLDPTLR